MAHARPHVASPPIQRVPSVSVASAASDPSSTEDRDFCRTMLPRVSRTFAVCIRLLPPRLEHPVLVSYLLCRVADTVEDTTLLDPSEKRRLLTHFSHCLAENGPDAAPLRGAFETHTGDDELLAREADTVLREFRRLPAAQRCAVRPWVEEMCNGMAEFTSDSPDEPVQSSASIHTLQDLERYCYYVAGTVGHLLTELFGQHSSINSSRYARMKSLATSFGLGLQLTNIIKDVADDRRRGRSFVPRQLRIGVGITPHDAHADNHDSESRQAIDMLIDRAKGHLCDALEYSTTLPRRLFRVRAFCLTSFYFAVRTIRLAERDPRLLDPDYKLKITRGEVHRTLMTTKFVAPVNVLVKGYFRRLAGERWWRLYLKQRTAVHEAV